MIYPDQPRQTGHHPELFPMMRKDRQACCNPQSSNRQPVHRQLPNRLPKVRCQPTKSSTRRQVYIKLINRIPGSLRSLTSNLIQHSLTSCQCRIPRQIGNTFLKLAGVGKLGVREGMRILFGSQRAGDITNPLRLGDQRQEEDGDEKHHY